MGFVLVDHGDRSSEVMPRLALACRSFHRPTTAEGPHVEAGMLARHLMDLLAEDEMMELTAVLAEIETLYAANDPGIDGVLTVGLIESLQNMSDDADAVRIKPMLGPRTTAAWVEVERFWS